MVPCANPPHPPAFDWKQPDYVAVFRRRAETLAKIRADKSGELLAALKVYYRDHPADFINDWAVTFDPRNIERGQPALVPFLLFPKQREAVEYVVRKWRAQENGLIEKSREVGMSWLMVALAGTMCLFHEGFAFGFGSRKEEYVDKIGSPKSLFWKARMFLANLPEEFRGGWIEKRDAPHMRITIPATGSTISGEAGDGIGRGDRTSIYVVDEAAFLERPLLVDASLSATTNCRIDVSSANGQGNPFAQKRASGKIEVFTLHWRDDPRKDEAWYAAQVAKIDNPVIIAQELDINYAASATGVLIPGEWVQAAIGAAGKLGLQLTGDRRAALDVADEGPDLNALCERHGISVESVTAWSGAGSDIAGTVAKAFGMCDEAGITDLDYDADGLGAGVRGDARLTNEARASAGRPAINVQPFRGSGAVFKPDDPIPSATPVPKGDRSDRKAERTNKDYFANAKAQAWWGLRLRFQRTVRALDLGDDWRETYSPDDLISLRADMPELAKLTIELSQPTFTVSTVGKVTVDKAPDGTRSPNHADAVMIAFAPRKVSWFSLVR